MDAWMIFGWNGPPGDSQYDRHRGIFSLKYLYPFLGNSSVTVANAEFFYIA